MAWDIIRKGPERLQSQFAAGYGMVLNLLYSRTLQEAKAFIDRSFNTYLSEHAPTASPLLGDITVCHCVSLYSTNDRIPTFSSILVSKCIVFAHVLSWFHSAKLRLVEIFDFRRREKSIACEAFVPRVKSLMLLKPLPPPLS